MSCGHRTANSSTLVSVVITSHNYGRFLKQCIDSALSQSHRNTEVIVVDDGSHDNSRDIITSYGNNVLSIMQDNTGQASAFNVGFYHSRGEMIIFLDSDDLLLSNAGEIALHQFDDPSVAKVHWPLFVIDEDGNMTGKICPWTELGEGDLSNEAILRGAEGYGWPPTSGNAWSRRCLERILPMPEAEYQSCADFYLAALAPLYGPVKRVQEPQGYWREHSDNSGSREPFHERVRLRARRSEICLAALSSYCDGRCISPDPEMWRANSWWHQLDRAAETIMAVIPPKASFLLVDQGRWGTGEGFAGRRSIPFPERDGEFAGTPADEKSVVQELERLRQSGADYIVFGWPYLWWLDHFSGLRHHLRTSYPCIVEDDRVVIFKLRG
jgi:glycosyltransferase involved in cell wall biosynthesis